MIVDNLVFYREQTLESIARNAIKKIDSSLLICDPCPIPIEILVEDCLKLQLEYQHIRKNGRILGETVFEDAPVAIYDKESGVYTLILVKKGTIIIDASLLLPKK